MIFCMNFHTFFFAVSKNLLIIFFFTTAENICNVSYYSGEHIEIPCWTTVEKSIFFHYSRYLHLIFLLQRRIYPKNVRVRNQFEIDARSFAQRNEPRTSESRKTATSQKKTKKKQALKNQNQNRSFPNKISPKKPNPKTERRQKK